MKRKLIISRRQVRRDFLRKLAIEAAMRKPISGRKLMRLFTPYSGLYGYGYDG